MAAIKRVSTGGAHENTRAANRCFQSASSIFGHEGRSKPWPELNICKYITHLEATRKTSAQDEFGTHANRHKKGTMSRYLK